jgi:hypothetical protein
MKCRIGIFRKTEHFMLRQWERKIDDTMVESVLLQLKQAELSSQKNMVVVSRTFLKRRGFHSTAELFIVIDQHVLITCFHSNFQEYFQKGLKFNYIILQ